MSQDHPPSQATCPSPKRIHSWLDQRAELSAQEVEHVGQCPACLKVLEGLADEPALAPLVNPGRGKGTRFDDEPEFRTMQAAVRAELAVTTSVLSGSRVKSILSATPTTQSPGLSDATASESSADESPDDTPTPLHCMEEVERRLPGQRYQLQRELGAGGSGIVYLAFDRLLTREVAIKVLTRNSHQDRRRLEREARLLAELDHPNVVRVHDLGTLEAAGDAPQAPYLVMEFVSGGTIGDIRAELQQDFRRLSKLVHDAALGLAAAHAKGLIHRDIKPTNLLLDAEQKSVKVADFGLAKLSGADSSEVTQTGDIVGTPAYMSPEQIGYDVVHRRHTCHDSRPIAVTSSTDIYSLGLTLYYVITGQRPLQGSTAAVLRQIPETEPVAPRLLNPNLPADLETICLHAIEKSPANRYADMDAFAADLQRFIDGRPTVARPLSSSAKLLRWSLRNRALAAALAGVLLLAASLGLGGTITASVLWEKNRRLDSQQQTQLRELCSKVAVADPHALPLAISQLRRPAVAVIPYLERLWAETPPGRSRLNLACALASLGAGHEQELVDSIPAAPLDAGRCIAVTTALAANPRLGQELLTSRFDESQDVQERVKLAICLLHLGEADRFETLASSEPDVRTQLIHSLSRWHSLPGDLVDCIEGRRPQRPDWEIFLSPNATSAICLALGLIGQDTLSDDQLLRLNASLRSHSRSDNRGLAGAAAWLMRKFASGSPAPQHAREVHNADSLAGHPMGFRMVHIAAGKFTMGSNDPAVRYGGRTPHPVTLTQDYLLADREVSVGLFRQFLEASFQETQADANWAPDPVISGTESQPVQMVTWEQAVQFCNWLSQEQGLQPCYQRAGELTLEGRNGEPFVLNDWQYNSEATGYRLPTEAEFEFACRAGTETVFSFGNSMQYFEHYAAWSNNTRVPSAACGSLLPNPWGLHEMHGNVWEWCQDWYLPFDDQAAIAPLETEPNANGRAFRGGGVCTYTGYPESSSRGSALPNQAFNNVGFRVARTVHSSDASQE